jgi:hypothetical protein
MYKKAAGIKTSRGDGLSLKNIRFHNFDASSNKEHSAIFMCSVCLNECEKKADPATLPIEQITFNKVTQKVYWHGKTKRDIIEDKDGSLSGDSNKMWYTKYMKHLESPSCAKSDDPTYDDSMVCNKDV